MANENSFYINSQPTINRMENGKQELSKTIELAIRYILENRNKQLEKG